MSSFRVPSSSRSLHQAIGKDPVSRKIARAALGLAVLVALAPTAHAMESLTYKGTLRDGEKAANGTYDLQVQLFSAEHGGKPITFPITLPNVAVKNGSFQVPVDLPGKLPANAPAWLQAQIKPPGSSAFYPLNGRQQIDSTLGNTCWEVGGNTAVTSPFVGVTDTNSALLAIQNNDAFLYVRSGGGIEQDGSLADGASAAAFNASSAEGAKSFTVGRGATAAAHSYSTVFADGQGMAGSLYQSTGPNQFIVRAVGGVGINTNAPRGSLSVQRGGGSGAGAVSASAITAESDTNTYMTLLTPSTQERGILFGDETNTAMGGIIFDTLFPSNNNGMSFRTGGNLERMRLTSAGFLRLNVGAEPPVLLGGDVIMREPATGAFTMRLQSSAATAGTLLFVDTDDTFSIIPSGDMEIFADLGISRLPALNKLEVEGNASKTTAGSWLANSDRRIKQDIAPIDDALALINRIEPVTFLYTDAYRGEHATIASQRYYNVIAQDFAEVFPDAVKGSGEFLPGMAKTKANEILQVDTYPATIASIAAIQELDAKSSAQDDRVTKLEAENAALRTRLTALEQALLGQASVGKR